MCNHHKQRPGRRLAVIRSLVITTSLTQIVSLVLVTNALAQHLRT